MKTGNRLCLSRANTAAGLSCLSDSRSIRGAARPTDLLKEEQLLIRPMSSQRSSHSMSCPRAGKESWGLKSKNSNSLLAPPPPISERRWRQTARMPRDPKSNSQSSFPGRKMSKILKGEIGMRTKLVLLNQEESQTMMALQTKFLPEMSLPALADRERLRPITRMTIKKKRTSIKRRELLWSRKERNPCTFLPTLWSQ